MDVISYTEPLLRTGWPAAKPALCFAQGPETAASSLDQIGRNNASSISNSYSEEMESPRARSAAKQELGVLETYRCNTDYLRIKRHFWRVTHAESQAKSISCGDIVASKMAADVQSHQDLKQAVERHLDWSCRIPSSFISVFDDKTHAINWAINARNRQEKRREYSPVYVQEINTAYLDDVCVLDLRRIVRELDISFKKVEHEYLILYNIPRHAVESNTDVAILEEQALETLEQEDRWKDQSYHWVDDLHGYYDTDEECEEHNMNDDLIKMIEGDWN